MNKPKSPYKITFDDAGNLVDVLSGYPIVAAAKQQGRIRAIWRDLLLFFGKKYGKELVKSQIVITGAAATGKTVLAEHMSGNAFEKGWIKPEAASTSTESQLVDNSLIRIVPGQEEAHSTTTLTNAFNEGSKLEGIIHVVDFGFNKIREPKGPEHGSQERYFIDQQIDNIDKLRKHFFINEAIYLKTLVQQLKSAKSKPKWLILAVNKCDLYLNDIHDAMQYYDYRKMGFPKGEAYPVLKDEHGDTYTFKSVVEELVNYVGKGNLDFEVIPVFTFHENYSFNGVTIVSGINEAAHRYTMIDIFLNAIRNISERNS